MGSELTIGGAKDERGPGLQRRRSRKSSAPVERERIQRGFVEVGGGGV